jgi:hypothetical protein
MKKAHKQSHHRQGQIIRRFLRDWFTAYSALSPAIGLFVTVEGSDAQASSPTSRQRRGAKTTRLRRPQTGAFVRSAACVHRIPHPTFVTIGQTPLLSGTGRAEKCF